MTSIGLFNILVFFLLVLVVTKPLGLFMANLFEGKRTLKERIRPKRWWSLPGAIRSRRSCWRAPTTTG
jgi:K+-transporting ATPase A subunit